MPIMYECDKHIMQQSSGEHDCHVIVTNYHVMCDEHNMHQSCGEHVTIM